MNENGSMARNGLDTLRLLLVEDDPDDAALVLRQLDKAQSAAYKVAHVERLAAAMNRLAQDDFDAVLLDLHLPDCRGIESFERMQTEATGMPILILSGLDDHSLAIEAVRRGAQDYLVKGLSADGMLDRSIRYAIERSRHDAKHRMLTRVLRTLSATNRLILRQNDLRKLHLEVCAVLVEQGEFKWASLSRFDCERGELRRVAEASREDSGLPVRAAMSVDKEEQCEMILRAFREKTTVACEDVEIAAACRPGCAEADLRAHRTIAAFPIIVGGDAVGVIAVWAPLPFAFEAQIISLLEEVAADVGHAISTIRTEERLRDSEERFRVTFEQAAVGMAHTSPDGRFLRMNKRYCEILGYEPEEVVSKGFGEFTNPADLPRDLDAARRMLAGSLDHYATEKRYTRKDGSTVAVYLTTSLLRTADGRPNYFITIVQDLSELRQAEERLRDTMDKYRLLFERNQAGVYRTTREGRILECNTAFAKTYGYESPQHLIQEADSWQLYNNPADRSAFLDRLEHERVILNLESTGRRRDGKPVILLENVSLVSTGNEEYIEGTVIDITEKKALEQQLRQAQKMEAIGRLAGGIAHDFNNLLTAILGYGHMLEMQLEGRGALVEEVRQITGAADRAAALTRQLLAFSRKQVLLPEVLDLNRVITNVEKMLRRVIGEDIELEMGLDGVLWNVKADPGQIEQVVMNLVVNARDAMPRGGRISIATRNVECACAPASMNVECEPGEFVEITVTDTGQGMSAETLAHIFEPFFTTKPEGKGTGLGLATVYGIVTQSGGRIAVASTVGQGTCFQIYLPRIAEETAPAHVIAAKRSMPGGEETIMIVEDDRQICDVARKALEALGYTVLAVTDTAAAVAHAASYPASIDLLLSDVVMPNMGGPELAGEIRLLRPRTKVLFMSGYADEAWQHTALTDESAGYIQKPYTLKELAEAVRRVLDGGKA